MHVNLFPLDGALIISNVSRHLKLLNAHIQFLGRHIRDKPEMLKLGNDVADASHMAQFTQDARKNVISLS